MAIKTENIAARAVMPPSEGKLPDPLYMRLLHYRTSMAVLRSMVKNCILTDSDFQKSCDILAKKYGLSLCSIFR